MQMDEYTVQRLRRKVKPYLPEYTMPIYQRLEEALARLNPEPLKGIRVEPKFVPLPDDQFPEKVKYIPGSIR